MQHPSFILFALLTAALAGCLSSHVEAPPSPDEGAGTMIDAESADGPRARAGSSADTTEAPNMGSAAPSGGSSDPSETPADPTETPTTPTELAKLAECVIGIGLAGQWTEEIAVDPAAATVTLTLDYPRASPDYPLHYYQWTYEVVRDDALRAAVATGEGVFAEGLEGGYGPMMALGRDATDTPYVFVPASEAADRCPGLAAVL